MEIKKTEEIEIFGLKYEFWYDHSVRVWYGMLVDSDGNQVDECIDTGSGRDMLLILIGADASYRTNATAKVAGLSD